MVARACRPWRSGALACAVILHAALWLDSSRLGPAGGLRRIVVLSLLEGFQATEWNPVPTARHGRTWSTRPARNSRRLSGWPPSRPHQRGSTAALSGRSTATPLQRSRTLLLDSDRELSAPDERMNPAGSRFIISLGYETLVLPSRIPDGQPVHFLDARN